jgi:hypothetical protein
MITVYGLLSDNGDGSGSIHWFTDKDYVDSLLDSDEECDVWYGNEGSPAVTLSFPDDLSLEACGFHISKRQAI